MPSIERKITVIEPSYIKPIHIVQGSNMQDILITITDWNIPSDSTLYWQIAQGDIGEYNIAALDGNTVIIQPYTSTFKCVGENYLQVRIEREGKVLISFETPVYVEPDRVTTPTEGSNSDVIKVLVDQYVDEATEDLIDQVETEVQRVIATIPSDYTALSNKVDYNAVQADSDTQMNDSQLVIPCDDSYEATIGTDGYVRKYKRLMMVNGTLASTQCRCAIYGAYKGFSSSAPTYERLPDWYHDPCDLFVIGHRYLFEYKLISGSIDRGAITDNFIFEVRKKDGEYVQIGHDLALYNTWECTFVPEYVGFTLRNFTYNDAVIGLQIVDLDLLNEDVYTSIYEDTVSQKLHIASSFYAVGEEIPATKTQYKYLMADGDKDISTQYPTWYVTAEIDVEPCTVYYITASARSADHRAYAIYDVDGKEITEVHATAWNDIKSFDKQMIYTPYRAKKIRLASIYGDSQLAIYSAVEKEPTAEWFGKKWACMGDSLTEENSRATKHYHDYISEDTGITVINLGKSGTGYMKPYNDNLPFYQRVDTIPTDSDVITIFGSGNDLSLTLGEVTDTGTTTICGCINNTIDSIRSRIVGANIGIITPTPWVAYPTESVGNKMDLYANAIVEICKRKGVPCLDLYHCSNMLPWEEAFRAKYYKHDDGNGVHPDEDGHLYFSPKIKAFVKTLLM